MVQTLPRRATRPQANTRQSRVTVAKYNSVAFDDMTDS